MTNIIRFNYPFYISAIAAICLAAALIPFLGGALRTMIAAGIALAGIQLAASVAASIWAYDLSSLYELDFLPRQLPKGTRVLNLSAGFDEHSRTIVARYPEASHQAYDFFEPQRHSEPSIRRARAAYPAAPELRSMTTGELPEPSASADLICVILAAHEIRDREERRIFFAELKRVLKPGGVLIVTEHLRDARNCLAYNIGALHFFPARDWLADFDSASLSVRRSEKVGFFIHSYTLSPSDDHSS